MGDEIINKVDQAGLLTLDINTFYIPGERVSIDIADLIGDELIIRESVFKTELNSSNWNNLDSAFVSVVCSKDIIVPPWAYLLIQIKLAKVAREVFFTDLEAMNILLFERGLKNLDIQKYKNKRVFLKICSNNTVPLCAISLCTQRLMPHVKSLFYGEPCSSILLIKN